MQQTMLFIVHIFIILWLCNPVQVVGRDLVIILNGSELDREGHGKIQHTYEYGRSGQTSSWVNSRSGNLYYMTPQPAFSHQSTNQPCRKATIQSRSTDQEEKISIVFCRSSDGNWIIQEITSPAIINQPDSVSPPKSRSTIPPSGHRWKKVN